MCLDLNEPRHLHVLCFIVPGIVLGKLMTSYKVHGQGFMLTTEKVRCDDLEAIKAIDYVISHTQHSRGVGQAAEIHRINHSENKYE